MAKIFLVALILGILMVASRIIGVFYPRKLGEWARDHFVHRDFAYIRFVGFAMFIISGFLIYIVSGEVSWMEALTAFVLILMFAKSCMLLLMPEPVRGYARSILSAPRWSIRIFCLAGVVIGCYLIVWGWRGLM